MRRGHLLVALVLLGLALEGACLWLDRVSVENAIVSKTARSAILAVFAPIEARFGAVPHDLTDLTGENYKIAGLLAFATAGFIAYVLALTVSCSLPPNDRAALGLILAFGLLFRLTLCAFPPVIETDHHRYIWDGKTIAMGINPYRWAPDEVQRAFDPAFSKSKAPAEREELRRLCLAAIGDPVLHAHFLAVNHPKIPTIYPPLTQLLFGCCAALAPGRQEVLKLVTSLVDFAICLAVLALLFEFKRNSLWVIVYAWSPVVLKEYSNTGHHDPLATLLVLIALWYLVRGHPTLAGAGFGLGALAKVYPIVFAAVYLRRLGMRGVVVMGVIVGLGFLPFLTARGARPLEGLQTYARRWEFNSSLFALIDNSLADIGLGTALDPVRGSDQPDTQEMPTRSLVARAIVGVAMACLVVALGVRGQRDPQDVVRHAFLVVGAILVLSPVVLPWYFAWVMPFVAIWPSAGWLLLSGTINIYYIYFWHDLAHPGWGYKRGGRYLEYLPVFVLWSLSWMRRKKTTPPAGAGGASSRDP